MIRRIFKDGTVSEDVCQRCGDTFRMREFVWRFGKHFPPVKVFDGPGRFLYRG